MTQKNCIHHWLINSLNQGLCQICGATKDFATLLKQDTRLKKYIEKGAK